MCVCVCVFPITCPQGLCNFKMEGANNPKMIF